MRAAERRGGSAGSPAAIGGEARNLVLLYKISDPRRSRGWWWPERGLPELCRRRAAATLDGGRRRQARPEMESARGEVRKHHLGAAVLVDAWAGVGVAGRVVVAVSPFRVVADGGSGSPNSGNVSARGRKRISRRREDSLAR